jgi:hypothetical protein
VAAPQTRDDYWRRGSVCEDFSRIEAATLAVGGWGDAYKNAVSRLVLGLSAPVKGIVGPWIHEYPHFAVPEPAIGFPQEALRWWDRWLKDIDTGVEGDPAMRLYVKLLLDLQKKEGVAYLFITHDLATVKSIADSIAVMYRGEVVRYGPKCQVLVPPFDPYTDLLLSSVPQMEIGWLDKAIGSRRMKSAGN